MTYEVVVPEYALDRYKDKLAAMNKRLANCGLPEIKIISKETDYYRDYENGPILGVYYILVLHGPEFIHNGNTMEFLGSIHYKEGVPLLKSSSKANFQLLSTMVGVKRCDHCNTNRTRNRYYLFRDTDQSIKVIGHTCAEEYLGVSAEVLCNAYADLQKEADSYPADEGGLPAHGYLYLNPLIAAVSLVTDGFTRKWVGKDTVDYSVVPTVEAAKAVLYQPTTKIRQEFIEELTKLHESGKLDLIRDKLGALFCNPTSEFEYNVRSAIYDPENACIRETVARIGLTSWAIYKAGQIPSETPARAETELSLNEYIGEIGEKIETELTVTLFRWFSTMYGDTALIVGTDNRGRTLKVMSSSPFCKSEQVGTTFRVKGTVKEHSEYNGVRQTQLLRVKVIN